MRSQVVREDESMQTQSRERRRDVAPETRQLDRVWFTADDASVYLGFHSYQAFWQWQKRVNGIAARAGQPLVLVARRLVGSRRLRYAKADLDRVLVARRSR